MVPRNGCTFIILLFNFLTWSTSTGVPIEVSVELQSVVGEVSERYLSVALGAGLIRERWHHWDFRSQRLRTLAGGLSPAYLRLGGTDADLLIFNPNRTELWYNSNRKSAHPKDSDRKRNSLVKEESVVHAQLDSCDGWKYCKPKYKTNFTMTADDWDQINKFSAQAGWRLLFDFNVFLSENGKWSTQNAKTLLEYSQKRGYMDNLDFELGNEPNAFHHNFNISISGQKLGQDFLQLATLLNHHQKSHNSSTPPSLLVGPDITRPRGKHSKSLKFLRQFLPVAGGVVDAVTWHQYYVNGRTAVVENFTDSRVLDLLQKQLLQVRMALRAARIANKKVWLGETSSAWGGGAKGLSDTYVAGFMWLDKLGLAALGGINTVMRQTFFGGHYALIDNNFQPRPDYWLSFLFKRLVGQRVISVMSSNDANSIRLYAHCTSVKSSGYPAGSITLYGMNLGDEDVNLTLRGDLAKKAVDQYWLTPHTPGKLSSALVRLNGKTLKMKSDLVFPKMIPKKTNVGDKISIPSKTFGFLVVSSVDTPHKWCKP